MAHGEVTTLTWLRGRDTDEPPLQNAIPLPVIEHKLVLRYGKAEIEDSVYFLNKRGYLITHGTVGITRVVLQLSKRAITALESRSFSEEEQQAFKEVLIDLRKVGASGPKFNAIEGWRRLKKRFWFKTGG